LQSRATVVTFGAGWSGRTWFEPDGRAALVALASAPVHLAETGPDRSLPHSVFCAAAVGAALLVLRDDDASLPPTEIVSAGSPEEAAATCTALLADPERCRALGRAARAWVTARHRLEPQWRSILAPHGVDR
jgi:hypothetical protein